MNPTPTPGVRIRMIDEIRAEIAHQIPPDGTDPDTLDQLTKALVDALMGLKSGRYPNEKRAAESIVTKLQNLVK